MNDPDECSAYAQHLHHEHGCLNRLLIEIGHEIAQLARADEPPGLVSRLRTRLADLRMQLQAHYAEEGSGGCLEEAVTRCPSLASDTKTILEEHPLLDQMLDRLIAQINDPATKPADLQQSWQAFYSRIQLHEAAETRLLRMAFGSDSADYDVEDID